MGAQTLREFASKTSDRLGDSTSTATVVAQAIVREGAKAVGAGMNPMDLMRGSRGSRSCIRATAEQCIKEGEGAIKRRWLSCRSSTATAVRLQLHAFAYNLGNFMRTLTMP